MSRTPPVAPTKVAVWRQDGRLRTRLRSSLLRPQQLHGPADVCRIALLGTTALLLGGDEVELEVDVGAGASLELVEVAGTVAYDGRGQPASWRVRVRVSEGGRLRWGGGPFVVADGAAVERSVELDVADGAQALLRETLVLGRTGQRGGVLRSRTTVRRRGQPVLVEDQLLDPDGQRLQPGMLGALRVVDNVLAIGSALPEPANGAGRAAHAVRYRLAEPDCTLVRHLGRDLARSPVHALWSEITSGY